MSRERKAGGGGGGGAEWAQEGRKREGGGGGGRAGKHGKSWKGQRGGGGWAMRDFLDLSYQQRLVFVLSCSLCFGGPLRVVRGTKRDTERGSSEAGDKNTTLPPHPFLQQKRGNVGWGTQAAKSRPTKAGSTIFRVTVFAGFSCVGLVAVVVVGGSGGNAAAASAAVVVVCLFCCWSLSM